MQLQAAGSKINLNLEDAKVYLQYSKFEFVIVIWTKLVHPATNFV